MYYIYIKIQSGDQEDRAVDTEYKVETFADVIRELNKWNSVCNNYTKVVSVGVDLV